MSFPAKANDFKDIDITSDEQASYLAIEAILNSTFEDLTLREGISHSELKHRIVSHEKFDEISNTIVDQKNLINSILAKNETTPNVTKLLEIQTNALTVIKHDTDLENRKSRSWLKYSAVGCFLILFVSLSSYSMFAIKQTHEANNLSKASVANITNSQTKDSSNQGDATIDTNVHKENSSGGSSNYSSNYGTNYSASIRGEGYTSGSLISLGILAFIFIGIVIYAYIWITKRIAKNKKQNESGYETSKRFKTSRRFKLSLVVALVVLAVLLIIATIAHDNYVNRPIDYGSDTMYQVHPYSSDSTTDKNTSKTGIINPQTSLSSYYDSSTSLIEAIKTNKALLKERFTNNENAVENYSSTSQIDGIKLNDLFYCENITKTFQGYSVFTTMIKDNNAFVLVGIQDSKTVGKIYLRCDILATINLD